MKFRGYPVHAERVAVGDETYELLAPDAPERLLDEPQVQVRFARDEYLPYWAMIWPAAIALAEEVAGWDVAAGNAPRPLVLELGCGLGLVGLVAARRGFSVIASDYDEDALAFAAANAERNGVTGHEVRRIDWRCAYPNLRPERILAADVLYERRNLEPLAAFIGRHLAPGGFALVSDAYRSTAEPFAGLARAAGFQVVVGDRREGRVYHLQQPG